MSDDPLRDALEENPFPLDAEQLAAAIRRALYRRGYAIVRLPGLPLQLHQAAWREVYDEGYRAGRESVSRE